MAAILSAWENFCEQWFGNPILKREFICTARKGRTVCLAAAALLLLAGILFMLWPRSGIFAEANSNELFTIFLGAELTFMILLTAGFTASAITAERERNTFALLQTSLLTPREILLGKLFGTLGMSLFLFLISVPVVALCALSGGISLQALCRALAVVATATVVYGLLGLAVSALCQRSYISLLVTYIGIVLLAGGIWLPSTLTQFPGLMPFFIRLRALSPYEALFAMQFADRYEIGVVGASADTVFGIFMISMLCIGIVCLIVFAVFIFNPPHFHKIRTVSKYSDSRTMIRRKLGWPFYLIDPMRRKKPIGMHRNPVFVAEIRSKIFGNPKFIIRSLTVCICISLGILALIAQQIGNTDLDHIRAVAIVFQLGLIALLAPTVSSGSITDEINSDTFLLLRLSPVSSMTVVTGKMKAALLYVMVFLLSSLPVFLALVYLEGIPLPDFAAMIPRSFSAEAFGTALTAIQDAAHAYWRIFAWVAVLVTTCLVLTSGGLCASCFALNTGMATAISYAFALTVCAGSLSVLLFSSRVSPELQAVFLMFNPFIASLEITLDHSLASRLPSLWGNRLWYNHLLIYSGLTVLLLVVSAVRVHFLFKEQK